MSAAAACELAAMAAAAIAEGIGEAVYDGRQQLGAIIMHGPDAFAVDLAGDLIGGFPTIEAARAAVRKVAMGRGLAGQG